MCILPILGNVNSILSVMPTINGNSNDPKKLVEYWAITAKDDVRYSLYCFNNAIAIESDYRLSYAGEHNFTLMSVLDGEKLTLPNKLQKIINNEVNINCDIQYSDGYIFIVNDYYSIAKYKYENDSIKILKTDYLIDDIYIVRNQIIVSSNYNVFCYDVVDFRKEWEYRTGDYISGVCFFDNNAVFACSQAGKLACVDLNTGNELWKIDKLGSAYYMGCALSNDKILAFNCGKVEYYDKVGKLLWSTDNLYSYSFYAVNDNQIILNNVIENKITSLNPFNGDILWEFKAIDKITSLMSNTKDIFFSTDDKIYILDKKDGSILYEDNKTMFVLGGKDNKNLEGLGNKFIAQENDKIKCMKFAPSKIRLSINSKVILDQDNDQYIMNIPLSVIHKSSFCEAKSIVGISGASLTFDNNQKKVEIYFKNGAEDILLTMQIGNPTATLNGKQVQIEPKNPKITPIIINGRTMVPLRFLVESLGCKVEWKPDTKEIIVTYQP